LVKAQRGKVTSSAVDLATAEAITLACMNPLTPSADVQTPTLMMMLVHGACSPATPERVDDSHCPKQTRVPANADEIHTIPGVMNNNVNNDNKDSAPKCKSDNRIDNGEKSPECKGNNKKDTPQVHYENADLHSNDNEGNNNGTPKAKLRVVEHKAPKFEYIKETCRDEAVCSSENELEAPEMCGDKDVCGDKAEIEAPTSKQCNNKVELDAPTSPNAHDSNPNGDGNVPVLSGNHGTSKCYALSENDPNATLYTSGHRAPECGRPIPPNVDGYSNEHGESTLHSISNVARDGYNIKCNETTVDIMDDAPAVIPSKITGVGAES
jgi:hypothetical protein